MSEFDEYIVHGEPGQKEKADTCKQPPKKVSAKVLKSLKLIL